MIPVFILALILLFSPAAYPVSVPVGGTAPDFTLSSVQGKTVSLKEFRGKIVVLIYWETGQERSVLALRDLSGISKKYAKKNVAVISVIADTENIEEARRIVSDNDIGFPVLLDSGRQVYGDYGVRVYPSTVVISKEGKLTYDIPGHALTYGLALESQIKYMLGEISEKELTETSLSHKETKDEPALEAERRYNLALKFAEARLMDQAIESVKKSLEAKPDLAKAHILLGFLLLDKKDAGNALEQFNEALKLTPGSHDAMTGRGAALTATGEIDAAIETLNNSVVANPYPQRSYYELGRAYEIKGHQDKAIEMYKKALDKIINKGILPSSFTSKCD